ncbi:MAG TPA: AAA family ATPase [Chloroflexota bacterium]|nr:AAA family ATPase [Chloroflexota bacterium]
MKVVCTGMSGTGRTSYVRAVAEMARAAGTPFHVFDVRDIMFEVARERGEELEEETILDVFPTALGAYRATALERIAAAARELPPEASWILVTHATFSWNYSIVPGLDVYYLSLLEPDLYVTITDGILSIRQRLSEERWKRVTINNLLWWRDVERASTEMMAAWQRKPHFLIGRRQGPETLYRLMTEPLERTVYLSYPMTHLEGEELLNALERFRTRLREKMIVFDPAAVDDFTLEQDAPIGFSDGSSEALAIGATLASNKLAGGGGVSLGQFSGVGNASTKTGKARDMVLDARPEDERGEARAANPENIDHIDGQIVDRDYKLVAQTDNVVVFYPTTTLSAGVICEMKEAIHRGKRVYALWLPKNPPSPFFTRYCTRWFREEEALFGYLDEAGVTASSSSSWDGPARRLGSVASSAAVT